MIEKLRLLNDSELIQASEELTLTSLPENSICRNLIPPGTPFAFSIIEINCNLVQVLAERLIACSPHVQK